MPAPTANTLPDSPMQAHGLTNKPSIFRTSMDKIKQSWSEAKQSQFTRVVGTGVPVEEEERIDRRTAWEDVTHAFGKGKSKNRRATATSELPSTP